MTLNRWTQWLPVIPILLAIALPVFAEDESPVASSEETDAEILATLTRIAEVIEESVRVGDRSVLERYGAPDMLLVNRDGKTYTKQELIDDLVPPRPGYDLSFAIREPKMRRNGDSALLTFVLDEHLVIYGHDVSTTYRCNFVFFRREGSWRLVLFEYFEKPIDPTIVNIEPARLDAWVGTYELAPGKWITKISREGDKLMSSRDGAPPKPLLPFADGRFFYPGVEGEVVFESDGSGRTTGMIFRRNFKDLRYRRVADPPTDGSRAP